MSVALSQTAVIFAKGDRLAVRLYDTPGEAREAGERALRDGTAESYGIAKIYEARRQ